MVTTMIVTLIAYAAPPSNIIFLTPHDCCVCRFPLKLSPSSLQTPCLSWLEVRLSRNLWSHTVSSNILWLYKGPWWTSDSIPATLPGTHVIDEYRSIFCTLNMPEILMHPVWYSGSVALSKVVAHLVTNVAFCNRGFRFSMLLLASAAFKMWLVCV